MNNTMSLNSIGIGGPLIRDEVYEFDDHSSLVSAAADTKLKYWKYNMMEMIKMKHDNTSLVSAARRYHSPAIRDIQ